MSAKETVRKFYALRPTRYGILAFDLITVSFFIASSALEMTTWFLVIDYFIAAIIAVDLVVRLWISKTRGRFCLRLLNIADVLVLVSLLAPALVQNLAFLRVLRVLRILRSYHLMRELGALVPWARRNEEVLHSTLNLVVFVFIVTAFVYVLQVRTNAQINTYLDALYFTVTTLTTTGFGDITPQGPTGRFLAIVIMVVGVALFLRLVQTIFRPPKVHNTCTDCGLMRHEPDAVHCKHCGALLNIQTDGEL